MQTIAPSRPLPRTTPSNRMPPRRPRRNAGPLLAAGLVVGGVILFLFALIPAALAAAGVVGALQRDVFDLPPLPDQLDQLSERSVVLDRHGNELALLRIENRITAEYGEFPEHLIDAVIATEDQTFWKHGGVNWLAITRAAVGNVAAGDITGGGSTITQQLMKNLLVGDEQSLTRKLQEAAYAREVEGRLSKEEILELYLNESYFGNGVYGAATAADHYWGKPVSELTLDQAALLAGMIRSPENNDPIDHPDRALARRKIVLEQMVEQDLITAEAAQEANATPLELNVQPPPNGESQFFIDYVRSLLEQEPLLGDDPQTRWNTVLRSGLVIETTLDSRLQKIADRVIREQLTEPGDPLASLVTVNPRTGAVLALGLGPKDYGNGEGQTQVNPAVPGLGGSGRQAGSVFKAFQLVTSIEDGIPPTHKFDAGSSYTAENPACGQGYEVENFGGTTHDVLDLREATALSSNTYYMHLLDESGPQRLVEVTKKMGITSPLDPHCSLALGTADVFPLEMATSFGTLANNGKHCPPFAIKTIRDHDGETIFERSNECERAIDKDVAAQTTDLLRSSIEEGTASHNGQVGRPAAGKTGTTTDAKDAWFVGYVPQLSTAAWVGHEIPEELEHPTCGGEVTGGCLPTIIWRDFMIEAFEALNLEVEDFPEPPPPPKVEVPDVVGWEQDDAVDELEEAGFTVSITVVHSEEPAGIVVDQTPDAGTRIPAESEVNISVSNGQPEFVPETFGARLPPGQEWDDEQIQEWEDNLDEQVRDFFDDRGRRPPGQQRRGG